MTPEEFKDWRLSHDMTQQQAADRLGLSKATVLNYEAGRRREDDRPVTIPASIALACMAITHGYKVAGRKGSARTAKYLIYTPNPNDWLAFTAELIKIGKVSTDNAHAVALSTEEPFETVMSVIRDQLIGRAHVIAEITGDFSYGGPTAIRNLVDAIK